MYVLPCYNIVQSTHKYGEAMPHKKWQENEYGSLII